MCRLVRVSPNLVYPKLVVRAKLQASHSSETQLDPFRKCRVLKLIRRGIVVITIQLEFLQAGQGCRRYPGGRSNRRWQHTAALHWEGRLSICLDLTQKLCVIIMIKVPVCGTDRQAGRQIDRQVGGWLGCLGCSYCRHSVVQWERLR